MSQHVLIPRAVSTRARTVLVTGALIAVLVTVAIVGVALVDRGSESALSRSAPASSSGTLGVAPCAIDVGSLLSMMATMPPGTAAQVVAQLSPELSQEVQTLAVLATPDNLPPPPDSAKLGKIVAHLDLVDRNAILSAVPVEQQAAVLVFEQSELAAFFASGIPISATCG